MHGDELVLVADEGGVDASLGSGLGERETPERLTRAGVDGEQGRVAAGTVEHALAVPEVQIRLGEGVVLRTITGCAGPDEFPGLLVERVEPVAGRTVRAPRAGDAADDDQFLVHDRRGGPAVGEGQSPELLHHRMFPEDFAVGREAQEDALRALDVDVAGLGIDRRAGSGVAEVDGVAEEIRFTMFPDQLPGFRVETAGHFLQFRAVAEVAVDVEPAVRDDRCRLTREGRRPEGLLGVDLVRQPLLPGNARLFRPAPVEPTADGFGGSGGKGAGQEHQ